MPARRHKKANSDLDLFCQVVDKGEIVFGHDDSASWLRVDGGDGYVTIDSSDMDGKPRLNADGLECLIDWLTEHWNEMP